MLFGISQETIENQNNNNNKNYSKLKKIDEVDLIKGWSLGGKGRGMRLLWTLSVRLSAECASGSKMNGKASL